MDSIDARLEAALAKREPAVGDDGFSDAVMIALPRRKLARAKANRWGLSLAVAIGGGLTLLFGAPLDSAVPALASGAGPIAILVAVIVAALCAPTAWAFYSR
jgi:hypothetical protein